MSEEESDSETDTPAATFAANPEWESTGGWSAVATADDPNDDLFGHVVEPAGIVDPADEDGFELERDAAVVLVGEPYDGAVVGRPGARDGPVEIRRSLARVKTHHFDGGPVGSVADLGDVRTLVDWLENDDDRPVEAVQSRLVEATARVHDLEALPVFLGGDNSLSYPNVAPLAREESVGVINVDAHLDVREPVDGPSSGTPYRQLFEDGLDRYACVGARHFETSSTYHDFVRDRRGELVTAEEVGEDTVAAAGRALEAMADVDHVYVSVDCDVLDAAAAPGVSAPTPGGITTRELYRLLRFVAGDDRIAGFEVVECAPGLDRGTLTVDASARAVAHFLAGYLEGRR
ncbi:formimidoylglutamase [Natronobacterium gregoryi]|uniref:Formimidoylglutamase n=2 Tax=Natronobacterium gregoryi TaxID=44930 RepID=L0ABW8_NATGS|nr:formimidoylglutamase [Natronobacterium gregoryi]AFZ71393.1 formimidoylglutamase [Natronobacterium gregoryi SP2]ELY66918.1 formiminoglutamase [Natronobacterium gregoryi SP2]PLK21228.1 formimidoylglutamase [Natronobacterium gregoryi SP2]SFI84756.1 formiminoglutamase [Natronobacterium gregoryi]